MKLINYPKNLSHSLVVASLLTLAIGLGSCQEEDEISVGPPTIERVRTTDPTTVDSSLTSATLGTTLSIMGTNFLGTQQVYLNDYPLGVNTAYVTNNAVIVTVSDSVPTVATNPDVPNTLRLVTKSGESIINFQTLPPAPQILQVKNQYVKPGDELELYGRYFYFVDTVYFPGTDVFVTSGFETNGTGTSLKVTVPDGMDFSESQSISVVTRSGGSVPGRTSQIYAGKGMIADFDTNGALEWPWNWGWGLSGEMIKPTQPGIESLEGSFAGMNQAFPANWGWNNDKVINLTNWGGVQIFPTDPSGEYDPSTPANKFDFRVEMAVSSSESIDGLLLQFWFPDKNGNELSYNVPITDFVRETDGSWFTVSMNASQLTNGTTRLSTYQDLLDGDGWAKQIRLVVINPTSSDVQAVMGFDNLRLIRAVE